jgi:hypothetical protein
MAVDRGRRDGIGGISIGGILVIIGIIVAIVWSLWLGIVIALIGLIAFGGFVRGGGISGSVPCRLTAASVAPLLPAAYTHLPKGAMRPPRALRARVGSPYHRRVSRGLLPLPAKHSPHG